MNEHEISEKVKNFNASLKSVEPRQQELKTPPKYAFQSTEHFTDENGRKMVRRRTARLPKFPGQPQGKAAIKAAKRERMRMRKAAQEVEV